MFTSLFIFIHIVFLRQSSRSKIKTVTDLKELFAQCLYMVSVISPRKKNKATMRMNEQMNECMNRWMAEKIEEKKK